MSDTSFINGRTLPVSARAVDVAISFSNDFLTLNRHLHQNPMYHVTKLQPTLLSFTVVFIG